MIYLDNAATTFPKPEEVYSTVDFVQRNLAVNIGRGSYRIANEAMKIVDETRYLLSELTGIDNPNNVVLTPSATIAANEVLMGLKWDDLKTVYITPFEHNAIARPLKRICDKYGTKLVLLPFNSDQQLDIERMQVLFATNPPDYLIMNHVSNVTGAVVPVSIIAESAKKYDATVIVDGSQSLGLLDINLNNDLIDYLIFAGHKNLYSSWGVGGFISREEAGLVPVIMGGTGMDSLNFSMGTASPVKYEPGSPNIIAIASLNASLKWIKKTGIEKIKEKKQKLIDELVTGLMGLDCHLYMPGKSVDHSSVVSFNIDGYLSDEIASILSQDNDIAVRAGYHCAPYVHMLINTREFGGTVRASVSYFNEVEDIHALLTAIEEL